MFTTLKTIHWGRFLAGIAVLFTSGGLWYELGFAASYPGLTRFIALALAVITLLYNSSKRGDE